MSITDTEQTLLDAVSALGLFSQVDSLGRHGEPEMIIYPAAFAYFSGDGRSGREITEEYHIQVRTQNAASEAAAARDAYVLIDAVRTAIHGKPLIRGQPPAICMARELSGWDEAESVIEYTLKFQIVTMITIGM